MAWLYQYHIAECVIQIDSDSYICEQDMRKFLCLYEPTQGKVPDLRFSIQAHDDIFSFVFMDVSGAEHMLWQSSDTTEITASLETHLYTRLVQYLDKQDILSVHSSVANIEGDAIMFAGVSGAGKSSMCTAALLDGSTYLSDEFTLIDHQGMVHPFPRPMQWEHPEHPAFKREDIEATGLIHADYFDFLAATGEIERCHLWHPQYIQRKPIPLKYIVLHQYDANVEDTEIIDIPRYEALSALPEHLHVHYGLAKDLPRLNQRISKDCKCYRLRFSNVNQAWQAIKKEVHKKR
jgi:hypothetical protein